MCGGLHCARMNSSANTMLIKNSEIREIKEKHNHEAAKSNTQHRARRHDFSSSPAVRRKTTPSPRPRKPTKKPASPYPASKKFGPSPKRRSSMGCRW